MGQSKALEVNIVDPLANVSMPDWIAARYRASLASAGDNLNGALRWTVDEDKARSQIVSFVDSVVASVVAAGFGYLPVEVKRGKTEASRAVEIRVWKGEEPTESAPPDRVREQGTSTFYVPAQCVVDGSFLPVWLVNKKLGELSERAPYARGRYKRVPVDNKPVWPGKTDYLKSCLDAMLPIWRQMARDVSEKREATQKRQEAREATARQRKEEMEQRNNAITESEQARERAHQARLESMETIAASDVEWDEWIEKKNAYGSKTRTKTTEHAGACVFKFSGERVYILLADGQEIIKTRRNVRWTSCELKA